MAPHVMKSRRSISLAGGVIILIAGIVIFAAEREMRKHAILACVASIHQGLADLNPSEADLAGVKSGWVILSESESARIIVGASKIHSFDCSRVKSGEPHLDYWGRPFQVGARRVPGGEMEYRVWSKGGDGEAGTWDDLVSPYGERAVASE